MYRFIHSFIISELINITNYDSLVPGRAINNGAVACQLWSTRVAPVRRKRSLRLIFT